MKLNRIFLTLIAGAALLAGCERENPVNDRPLAVDVKPSLLTLDGKTASEVEVEVTATAAWTAAIPEKADWVSLDKVSGAAGTSKVKVSVLQGGDDARSAEIIFKAGSDSKILTVNQTGGIVWGTEDNPYTATKAYEWVSTLPADAKSGNKIYIKGIVCRIQAPYVADDYGNAHFFISDDGKDEGETTGKVFQCYRVLYLGGEKYSNPADRNVQLGDEVVIYGTVVNYKGNTPETAQNEAYLVSIKEGSAPLLACAERDVVVAASETEASFDIEAKNISGGWSVTTDAGWITDYTKSGTESGKIAVKFDANTGAERTATFTVSAAGVNDLTLTLKQGAYTEVGTLEKPYTVAEIIAALKEGEVPGNVYIKGIISNTTKYNYGPTYNTASFWISDDGVYNDNLDKDFEAYSTYWLGGTLEQPTAAADIKANFKVGDEVVLYGAVTAFTKDGKTTYETASKKAKIYSLNWAQSDENGVGNVDYPFNAAGAKQFIIDTQAAIKAAKEAGGTLSIPDVAVAGKASKIVYPYDAEHKTGTFWMSDDGVFNDDLEKDFEAYSVYWLENKEWQEGYGQVAVGDEVIILGQLTAYTKNDKTTYETSSKKAYLYSLNGETKVGDTPQPEETPALFLNEFDTKAKKMEIYNSTDKEVDIAGWQFVKDDGKEEKDIYTIPASLEASKVPAKGYAVFTCKQSDVANGPLFGLSGTKGFKIELKKGDTVVDVADNLTTITEIPDGKSWGRETDGADKFVIFDTPTIGAANVAPSTGAAAYKKVTSVTSGKKYLIVAKNVNGKMFAASPIPADKTYGRLNGTEVTVADDAITEAKENLEFTFTAVEGGFNITMSDGRLLGVDETHDNTFQIGEGYEYLFTVTAREDGTVAVGNPKYGRTLYHGGGTYTNFSMSSKVPDDGVYPCLFEKQ